MSCCEFFKYLLFGRVGVSRMRCYFFDHLQGFPLSRLLIDKAFTIFLFFFVLKFKGGLVVYLI